MVDLLNRKCWKRQVRSKPSMEAMRELRRAAVARLQQLVSRFTIRQKLDLCATSGSEPDVAEAVTKRFQ